MMDVQHRELLVMGYIKSMETNESLSSHIPSCVCLMVIEHYPLRFSFEETDNVQISSDGLTACKEHTSEYLLLRFGTFLSIRDHVIVEVVFNLDNVSPSSTAFGFMAPNYVEPALKGIFNLGGNHTMSITGIGYMVSTPSDFTSAYTTESTKWISQFESLWDKGDQLHVEVDMIHKIGRIWNNDDVEMNHVFEIGLPESVAIMIDFGQSQQNISVISQSFRYS
eukprot:298318_1